MNNRFSKERWYKAAQYLGYTEEELMRGLTNIMNTDDWAEAANIRKNLYKKIPLTPEEIKFLENHKQELEKMKHMLDFDKAHQDLQRKYSIELILVVSGNHTESVLFTNKVKEEVNKFHGNLININIQDVHQGSNTNEIYVKADANTLLVAQHFLQFIINKFTINYYQIYDNKEKKILKQQGFPDARFNTQKSNQSLNNLKEKLKEFFNIKEFTYIGRGAFAGAYKINDSECLRISQQLPKPIPDDPYINQRKGFMKIGLYYVECFPLLTDVGRIPEDELVSVINHLESKYNLGDLHDQNFGRDPQTGVIKMLDPGEFSGIPDDVRVVGKIKQINHFSQDLSWDYSNDQHIDTHGGMGFIVKDKPIFFNSKESHMLLRENYLDKIVPGLKKWCHELAEYLKQDPEYFTDMVADEIPQFRIGDSLGHTILNIEPEHNNLIKEIANHYHKDLESIIILPYGFRKAKYFPLWEKGISPKEIANMKMVGSIYNRIKVYF